MKHPVGYITQQKLVEIQRGALPWVRVFATDDGASVPVYTWEQMQLAIIAEREACAVAVGQAVDLEALAATPAMQKYTVELLLALTTAIRARSE